MQRYDADYFLRGEKLGISNYTDYRWLEATSMPMAQRLIDYLGIRKGDSLLDYGCSRGFVCKALRRLGVEAWGCDISEWAVTNCDPEVTGYIHTDVRHDKYDFVLMKDLCEHIEQRELTGLIDRLLSGLRKAMLIIVPLSAKVNAPYVRGEDNKDVTHIIRWPLETWLKFLQRPTDEFLFQASWHVPGLKPTSLACLGSCGFITIRRNEAYFATSSD